MKPQRYRRHLLSGLLLFVAATFYGAQAAPTNDFPTSRTPVAWPFAWDSIWNLPIGNGATYVPAQIRYGDYGLYAEEDILILSPNAPLVDVIAHDADWDPNRKRCDSIVSPTQRLFTGVPVPNAFTTEPNYAGGGETPNHSAAILMPDGLTIRQTQPLHRCGVGGPVVSQYNFPDDHIKTGSGIDGAHGASSMSSLGGVIRLGELQPNSTIRHALKLVFDTSQYAYYNTNDPTPGYRWPALSADSHAPSTYGGQNPALEMGALLALKADFAVDNLRTEPAKIVARALRDYGAYWVDNAGWNAYYLTVEWSPEGRVLDEFEATWGFPFVSPQPATCTNTADAACRWSKDMGDIFTNLHVVNNNGPQSIGGPGVRRQPCAPPFSDGAGAAPEYCPRSGNQPSTPPPNSTPTATPTTTSTPTRTPTRTPTPIQSTSCGNGFIEAAEACDDGNRVSGDGCTNQCVIEQSCYDPGNTFSFFTWSDSYGSAGDGGAMRLFKDAVNRTLYPNRVLPRFWVAAGDVPFVPGIEPLSIEAINGEISGNNYPFTCSASNRTFPMFVALGNHDIDGDATQIATKFAYWRDTIGPRLDKTLVGIQNFRFGPHNGYDERTTYSFDYKNAHFVVVNQYYGDPTYPTSNPIACVRQTVYDWINQDLANTTRPIKFVFGHEPAWSYCSNAPGYNGCVTYGNNFTEDLLDPNERPRPYSPARQAWLEAYGRHWSDSLEDAQCPTINGQEGRSAFWAMLARHKVTAHLVGHTHTYGSRLVDADGPRNDPPMTQAERNRRAYGKNGDLFTSVDGVWEVDSAMTHNSAGSAYVLVTVRNNRVTFEAWDQMGAGAGEEPFRLVESWHVDVEGAAPTLPTGDCNSDGRVDAGDLSACAREIFDGDGNLAVNAPQGSFAGAATCDSNRDTLIAAGDLACTARLIFNSNATCTSTSATAVSNSAHLAIATGLSGAAGAQVTVPVALNTNGAAVTSAAFTLRFDANYLAFDPTDADNDKLPDAITDQLPAGAFRSVEVGDNTINIALTDLAEQPVALHNGPLLTVTFQVKAIVAADPVTATVAFDNSPSPSLGSVTGGEVAITTTGGAIRVQPVAPAVEFHLPLIRRQ